MFPSTDTTTARRTPGGRRASAAPLAPVSTSFLRRVAGTLRAFALLEDPELEARAAREELMVRSHHRRPARVQRARRPGAARPATTTSRPGGRLVC